MVHHVCNGMLKFSLLNVLNDCLSLYSCMPIIYLININIRFSILAFLRTSVLVDFSTLNSLAVSLNSFFMLLSLFNRNKDCRILFQESFFVINAKSLFYIDISSCHPHVADYERTPKLIWKSG